MKSRVWQGLLTLIVVASLITQIVLTATDSAPHAGPPVHETVVTRFVRLFSYFTIQSNLLVLIATVALVRNPEREGRLWRVIRLDAVLGIVITGIVYATILAGQVELHGAAYLADLGFHYIAPWAALLGWLLFGPRPRIDARTLAWASLWPMLWIGYTLTHGAVTDWYPYPFTDVTVIHYPQALINLGAVVLIAMLLAAVLRVLDTRLPGGSAAAQEAATQEPGAHEAVPQEAVPQEAVPQEAVPQEAAAWEAAPQEAAPQEAVAGEAGAREAGTQEPGAGEATPQEAVAGEATAQEAAPQKAAARETAAQETRAKETPDREAVPRPRSAVEKTAAREPDRS